MPTAQIPAQTRDSRAGVRKVTYSLPANLVAELDRRTAGAAKSKSAVVADALALYFAERDREALAAIYEEAGPRGASAPIAGGESPKACR